jgi:hypothetical protein
LFTSKKSKRSRFSPPMSLAFAIGRGVGWVVRAFVSMEIEIERERVRETDIEGERDRGRERESEGER